MWQSDLDTFELKTSVSVYKYNGRYFLCFGPRILIFLLV